MTDPNHAHWYRPCLTVLTLSALAAAASAAPVNPASRMQPTNVAGQPILAADGTRIQYTKQTLKSVTSQKTARSRGAPAAPRSTLAPTDANFSVPTMLGTGVGLAGMAVSTSGARPEVIAAGGIDFGPSRFWTVMRARSGSYALTPVYGSPMYDSPIQSLLLLTPTTSEPERVLVALANGTTHEYDLRQRALLRTYAGPCTGRGGLSTMTTADLDQDGQIEQVSVCADGRLVAHRSAVELWSLAGIGASTDVVVGQMDDDASLEIATTSGNVIDVATRSVQWYRPSGFGRRLAVSDTDSDGKQELIAADSWYWVYGYDVDRKLPQWSLRMSLDIASLQIADVDGDGKDDMLLGDGQWGAVNVFDPTTRALKGKVANPDSGVSRTAVADINADGKADILFGAGYNSTASDHLHIANWATRAIAWSSTDLSGPFIGPERGDIDGDGLPELVMVSTESDSGYGSGRIIVMDELTRRIKAISDGVVGNLSWEGVRDLKLRDLNGDGVLEVLIGADRLYDGVIEAYSMKGKRALTLVWQNATMPSGSPFNVVDAADIDGDGVVEILGANGVAHSGSQGNFVYAYSLATGQELWHTLHMRGSWSGATGMMVKDFDADGTLEIAVLMPNQSIYLFDGRTHQLEALFDHTDGISLGLLGGDLAMGSSGGSITRFDYNGATLVAKSNTQYLADPVEGFTDLSDTHRGLWIGSQGRAYAFDKDGIGTLMSSNYGMGTGRRAVMLSNGSVATTGERGLIGFKRPGKP